MISFDIYSRPSDMIRDGLDGYLIKPWDCREMAEKVCNLIENEVVRERMSSNTRSNISIFSKEMIIKQWINLIDEVMKKH